MPTIQEILVLESCNVHHIHFYREGVFYKAYDRSAYLFVHHIKPFQVKKKFVKQVGTDVVSVGFPTNSITNYFPKEKILEEGNKAEVDIAKSIDVAAFELWKSEIPLSVNETAKQVKSAPAGQQAEPISCMMPENEISMKIKMFPIEGKTPLECMLFLSELKKTL